MTSARSLTVVWKETLVWKEPTCRVRLIAVLDHAFIHRDWLKAHSRI